MNRLLFHVSYEDKIHNNGIELPQGNWGKHILSRPLSTGNYEKDAKIRLDNIIELVFEQVRKEMGIGISRLNCHFAFKSVESAKKFNDECRSGRGVLYQILVDDKIPIFEGDFNLISHNHTSISKIIENARRYWSGEKTSDLIEVLIDGPMKILERVEFPKA